MDKNLHLLLAFDSFKGCLGSRQVAEHFAKGWASRRPEDRFTLIPLADGGEGTLEAFSSMGGEMKGSILPIAASGTKEVFHLELGSGEVVLEVAQTIGIEDLKEGSPPAMNRSSSHFGKQFLELFDKGARNFKVGLGGSCTTDGGLGFLEELGLRGLGEKGEIPLLPARLREIRKLEWNPVISLESNIIEILSDVTNPLFGPKGASLTFGPQKGLTTQEAHDLDKELMRIYDMLEPLLGLEVRDQPGAGAAGGMGAALMFLGGKARPGAEVLFDVLNIEEVMKDVDLVFSGEGRSDDQTVDGKGPFRLAQRAKACGKKTVLVSGSYDPGSYGILSNTFSGVHSILSGVMNLEQALDLGGTHLEQAGSSLAEMLG